MQQKQINGSTKLAVNAAHFILILVISSSLAFAQGGTRVSLQPIEESNETLVVDVFVENVTDLYGAEFRLSYDPAVLAVQDMKPEQDGVQIEARSLLPQDKGFIVANEADEAAGTVTFAMTLLNPAPAVSGSGALARVTFNILQNFASAIEVEHAKLVAVDLQTIPSETMSLAIGEASQAEAAAQNASSNEPPVPAPVNPPPDAGSSAFPWWIVAAVIMVLGILALGGFIVMGGLNKTTTAPPNSLTTPPQPNVEPSATYPRGTRPSAFKNQT